MHSVTLVMHTIILITQTYVYLYSSYPNLFIPLFLLFRLMHTVILVIQTCILKQNVQGTQIISPFGDSKECIYMEPKRKSTSSVQTDSITGSTVFYKNKTDTNACVRTHVIRV